MTKDEVSLIMSCVAVCISLCSFLQGHFTRRTERAKRISEAFGAAQLLKNELSDCQDAVDKLLAAEPEGVGLSAVREVRTKLAKEYQLAWDYVKLFEKWATLIESGWSMPFNSARIEAKIGLFNQRRILAEYDISWCSKKVAESTKAITSPR